MPIQPYSDISSHASSIRELAMRNPVTLTGSEQYNLQMLAVMCGYHQERVQNVRPADLLEVLKAAQYGPEKAVALTARIARANGVPVEADRADMVREYRMSDFGPEDLADILTRVQPRRAPMPSPKATPAPKLPDALPHGDYVTHPDLDAAETAIANAELPA